MNGQLEKLKIGHNGGLGEIKKWEISLKLKLMTGVVSVKDKY